MIVHDLLHGLSQMTLQITVSVLHESREGIPSFVVERLHRTFFGNIRSDDYYASDSIHKLRDNL
jgi:hypothetical protein